MQSGPDLVQLFLGQKTNGQSLPFLRPNEAVGIRSRVVQESDNCGLFAARGDYDFNFEKFFGIKPQPRAVYTRGAAQILRGVSGSS